MCYHLIFERSRDSIIIVGPDSRIIEANTAASNMTGYSKQELLGLSISDFVSSWRLSGACFDHSLSGEDSAGEAKFLKKDGTCIEIEFVSRSFVQAYQRYIRASFRDVSDKKHIERALTAERARNDAIMNHLPVLV